MHSEWSHRSMVNVIEYIFDENVKENGRDNWTLWKANTSLEPYSCVIIHYASHFSMVKECIYPIPYW
jgi:hypothetical protein